MKNNINPALKELKQFIGTWEMEISNAPFLPDPNATIRQAHPLNGLKMENF